MLSKKEFCIAILQEWCHENGYPRDSWDKLEDNQLENAPKFVRIAAYRMGRISCAPPGWSPMFTYIEDPFRTDQDKFLTFNEIYSSLPDRT